MVRGWTVGSGRIRNISGSTKFLGQTQSHSLLSTAHEAGKKFLEEFERQIHNLDCSPIQGEYKLWIYKRLVVPAFHFSLAVDAIPNSILRKMQSNAIRRVKKWLGRTRSCTTAVLHHLHVIDILTLSEFRTKAKLSISHLYNPGSLDHRTVITTP